MSGWTSTPRRAPEPTSDLLFGFGHLDGPEAGERAVDEEDLHRDVGLHVSLTEKREHLASGQRLDRLSVPRAITRWKSSRMAITRSGWPLSMIVCSSGVKPLPRITTTMMSSSA